MSRAVTNTKPTSAVDTAYLLVKPARTTLCAPIRTPCIKPNASHLYSRRPGSNLRHRQASAETRPPPPSNLSLQLSTGTVLRVLATGRCSCPQTGSSACSSVGHPSGSVPLHNAGASTVPSGSRPGFDTVPRCEHAHPNTRRHHDNAPRVLTHR